MNFHRTILAVAAPFLLMSALLPIRAAGPDGEGKLDWGKAREAVSEKQLQAQASSSRPMLDQLALMKRPMETAPPSPGSSLYSKSIILFDGEMYTLVPVGSVLHLPANLGTRVIAEARGAFTFWPNFLKRNASWLGAQEVPLQMAKGDRNLAEAVLKRLAGDSKLLVSVYRGCPITVLEPVGREKTTVDN